MTILQRKYPGRPAILLRLKELRVMEAVKQLRDSSLTNRIVFGIASLGLVVLISLGTVFAQEANISGTGYGSNNQVIINTSTNTNVNSSNSTSVSNSTSQTSTSGSASSSDNTFGGDATSGSTSNSSTTSTSVSQSNSSSF